MNTQLGWSTASPIRSRTPLGPEYDVEMALERGLFAGLAAFVAVWTFMLAALMAASISDNIKPAQTEIDIAKIEPPVPRFTPVPETPAPIYSLPAVDAGAPTVWTPPAETVTSTQEASGEDQITIERNPENRMPTKITIIGRAERGSAPNVISANPAPAGGAEQVHPTPLPRLSESPPAVPKQDAATRVIDDIF